MYVVFTGKGKSYQFKKRNWQLLISCCVKNSWMSIHRDHVLWDGMIAIKEDMICSFLLILYNYKNNILIYIVYLIYTYYCNDDQKIKCFINLLQNINMPSDHCTQVTNELLVLKYLINIHLNVYFAYRAW